MKKLSAFFCLCFMVFLAGCDQWKVTPVSVQDTPLVGHWYGEREQRLGSVRAHDRLYVQVMESGLVEFHFIGCEYHSAGVQEKHLDLQQIPIKRLTTVKMVLQSYPLTPKFELTLGAWPDQNAGVWEVDEIGLQLTEAAKLPDYSAWHCDSP